MPQLTKGAAMTHVELDDPSDRRDGKIADRASEARRHIISAVARQGVLNGLNFGVGLVVATIGLFMLYNFLPKKISELNEKNAGSYFLARSSLVALTETFAFFFLNLHRFGLSEAKYFRDELSNVNMRVLGLRVALEENDLTSVRHILKALGDTDWHPARMAPPRKRGDESLRVAEELIKLAGKNDLTSVTQLLKAFGDTDWHLARMASSRKGGDESLKVAEELIRLAGELGGGNLSTARAAEREGG
jgi:hypothetical protein